MKINITNFSPYIEQSEEMWYRGFKDYVKKHPEHQVILNSMTGADWTLDFQSNFLMDGRKLSDLSGKKILYFQDNLHRFGDYFWSIENQYDIVFLAHSNPIIDNVRYFKLGFGYCPYTHFPVKKKKNIDVCFVGTHHPQGRDFIKKIPNIKIYGNYWGNGIFPVYHAQKRAVHAKTKIMLNQHISGDTQNMRCWECLAMGTFMMSDIVPKELEGGVIMYDGFDDLIMKIEYYLDNEKEREKIAAKGRKMVQPYTYEKRAEELMEVLLNAQLG